ncbi:MAG: alkaline phosphatase family protein [Candidatus Binatia bacterium]|nr:alkaline phosphatase family protein [Candidatus Binatia bacterium]
MLRAIGCVVLGLVVVLAAVLLVTSPEHPGVEQWPPHGKVPAELVTEARGSTAKRTVVVLLFDGLAPALVRATETPTLDRLEREGAWTHSMIPPFPSISLIGGFTISTGCWPERHGIVTNRFFDPDLGFYDHSADADWVLECEQLHEAAERQGVRTATLGWYGQVSNEFGKLARIVDWVDDFKDYPDDAGRAEQVAALLRLPEDERPQLILAYFKGPDGKAHFLGMEDPETLAEVRVTDAAVGTVVEAIESAGIAEETALVVTTDHGMMPVSHILSPEFILREAGVEARMLATGSTAFVYLDDPSQIDEAARKLSGHEEFEVLRRDRPPPYSHLGQGPRVGDLILSAKPGFAMEDRGQFPWWLRWLAWTGPMAIDASGALHASHGHPPHHPEVHGVFYAWGDGVAQAPVDHVDAIDIHPTVTHLLGIEPGQPVDGAVATEVVHD